MKKSQKPTKPQGQPLTFPNIGIYKFSIRSLWISMRSTTLYGNYGLYQNFQDLLMLCKIWAYFFSQVYDIPTSSCHIISIWLLTKFWSHALCLLQNFSIKFCSQVNFFFHSNSNTWPSLAWDPPWWALFRWKMWLDVLSANRNN